MQVQSSKRMRRGGLAIAAVGTVLLAGCKLGGTDLGPAPAVHSVTFGSHLLDLTSCQAVSYLPTITADTGAVEALTWSSQDSSIALPDSLGHIHALKPGSAIVRASIFLDPAKFDTVRVQVTDPTGPFVTLAGVQQAATGDAANLSSVHDSVDVVLHVTPLGCRRDKQPKFTSAAVTFTGPASYTQTFLYPGGIQGSVFLRVNTARVDSATKTAVLPNGAYTLNGQVKSDSAVVYTTPNQIQLTIANP